MIFSLPAHHFFTILNSFFLPFILPSSIEHHFNTNVTIKLSLRGRQAEAIPISMDEIASLPLVARNDTRQIIKDVCFRKAIDNCLYGIHLPFGEMISRAFISSNISFENIFLNQYKTHSRILYI